MIIKRMCQKCHKLEEDIDQPVEDIHGRLWCWDCIEVEFFDFLNLRDKKEKEE